MLKIYFDHVEIQASTHSTETYSTSEEFELTANSLGAHIETHRKLILRTFSYLTVNSQDDSHCELSVSLPLTP